MVQEAYEMPFRGDDDDIPVALPDVASVLNKIQAADELVRDLTGRELAILNDDLATAQEIAMETAAQLTGGLDRSMDDVDALACKLTGKCVRQVDQLLSEAYGHAAGAGVVYPTNDQVIYGLESGKYLQSVDFTKPMTGPIPPEKIGLTPPMAAPGNPEYDAYMKRIADEGMKPPVYEPAPLYPTAPAPTTTPAPTFGPPDAPVQEPVLTVPPPPAPAPKPSEPVPPRDFFPDAPPPYMPPTGDGPAPVFQPTGTTTAPPPPPGPPGAGITTLPPGCGLAKPIDPLIADLPAGGGPGQYYTCPNVYTRQPGGTVLDWFGRLVVPGEGGCPPEPVDCKPKGRTGQGAVSILKPPDWGSLEQCNLIDEINKAITGGQGKLSVQLGFNEKTSPPTMPAWFKPIYDGAPALIDDLILGITTSVIDGLQSLLQMMPDSAHCKVSGMIVPAAIRGLLGIVNKFTGGALDDLLTSYTYWINSQCPTLLPGQAGVDQGYLTGGFTKEQWECYTKANNNHVDPAEKVMYGQRARPSITELIRLRRQEKLKEEDYRAKIRENGVLDEGDRARFEELFKWYPGPADLIRLMVRDTADEQVAQEQKTDTDFEKKWTGDVAAWGTLQGIDTPVARQLWRAHWHLPAPGQLFQMLHRNRPGRVEADAQVTESDVAEALQQQDYLPYWIPALTAISYHPLTRVDTQRAYFIGALSEDDVYESYRDLGYNDENAKHLVEFTKRLKKARDRKVSGFPTPSQLRTAYANFELTRQELEKALYDAGLDDSAVGENLFQARQLLQRKVRKARVKEVERRFRDASISAGTASGLLSQAGLDGNQVADLVGTWTNRKEYSSKEVTAERICRWRELNLITAQDQYQRLMVIGYLPPDAQKIVDECKAGLDAKARKAAEAEAKKQAAAEKAAAKLAEKNGAI